MAAQPLIAGPERFSYCVYCWEHIKWGDCHTACDDNPPVGWDNRYPWELTS